MTCPDFTERYFVVYWMFNAVQAAVVVAVWELEKWLWRMARGRSRLTADPEECKVKPRWGKR